MEGVKENFNQNSSSDPQSIPKPPSLKLDYSTPQRASFVSQRSSSLDSLSSSSHTYSSNGNLVDPATHGRSASDLTEQGLEHDGTVLREDNSARSENWLSDDPLSPSMSPDYQSTPVSSRENEYLSTVSEEEGGLGANQEEEKTMEFFLPGDLHTPIMGYETMESRSRFTVYKIQVQKMREGVSDWGPNGWFVFRRYSDFFHLNERLRYLFPGFRLSLPPKRWFRDNFDKDFLEDRMLGLQAFLNNITGHKDICNSVAVRSFLCTDDPPGPHDSLEESRALCDTLEETMYTLRQELQEKELEVTLLKEELELYKSQVELLSSQLRVLNSRKEESQAARSAHNSLAECDLDTDLLSAPTPHKANLVTAPLSGPTPQRADLDTE